MWPLFVEFPCPINLFFFNCFYCVFLSVFFLFLLCGSDP